MRKKEERIRFESNSIMDFAVLSVIGDRNEQQDAFGYSFDDYSGIFVVCDGMGGHECGQLASKYAVKEFISSFREKARDEAMDMKLRRSAVAADNRVSMIANERGDNVISGCTLVAVAVENEQLHWCSVGDSRAYLYRNGEFVQLTKDQNYRAVLDEQLSAGIITKDDYDVEISKGDALINYVGIGSLSFIDYNERPLETTKNDVIVIMTDGLYRLVADMEIKQIIENFSNTSDALRALVMKSKRAAEKLCVKRDNLTAVLIRIKQ